MKIYEMSIKARHSSRIPYLKLTNFSEKERQAALYANLSVVLSEVLVASQTMELDRKLLLDKYCQALGDFLLLASSQNIVDHFLVDSKQTAQIKSKWETKSFNILYLILEQQVQNSYFKHQTADLLHAWHMFLKLGLVDLKFDETDIESYFLEKDK